MKNTKPPIRNRSRQPRAQPPSHLYLWLGLCSLCGLGLIAFVLLLKLLLPVLILLGVVVLGYWIWRSLSRHHQRRRRRQARLNKQFYQLLKRQQGRISALDFAIYTQVDGIAAQDYLNQQAQAFSAYCETTIQGDIIYVFNQAAMSQVYQDVQYHNAWATRAWVEQSQAETLTQQRSPQQRKQQKAAWISAQQLNTLRRRSQTNSNREPIIPLPAAPDRVNASKTAASKTVSPSIPRGKRSMAKASEQLPVIRPTAISRGDSPTERLHQRPQPNDESVVTIEVKAVRS